MRRCYVCFVRKGIFAALALLLTACSTSAQSPRQFGPGDVVATVGTRSITLDEVDERALQQPASDFASMRLSQALYEARRAALDEIVSTLLLDQESRARGIDRVALLEREVSTGVSQPSDADISAWYQANRARVQGATLEQVKAPIRALLIEERTQAARTAYVDRLKERVPVKILLEPPRQTFKATSSPATGPATAPVEIIEFSDFQCPYCLAVRPTLKRVLDTYGNRVHFVYRNYPLPGHANARPAAEAAQCANEQGQFWRYHDRLFADPSKLSSADLHNSAIDLGLDATRFDACVASHKYKSVLDDDIQVADGAGVSGTPAFFINGRMLSGAQPFEAFKRIIDDELDRGKR
jgi:protein-disulfide isomerase